MHREPTPAAPAAEPAGLADCYASSRAERWGVPFERFSEVLQTAVQRVSVEAGRPVDFERALSRIHVEELALATACLDGSETAWRELMQRFQPELRRAARRLSGDANGDELADSLFGELYGVTADGRERRSLLSYFHGRSRLGTWLRAVLAQRHVDRIRATSRLDPLVEETSAGPADDAELGPDRARVTEALQKATDAAMAELSPKDRLRLSFYYCQRMTLGEIGRVFGEHEATVSRKLARLRHRLKEGILHRLSRDHGLADDAVRADQAADAGRALDLSRWLDGVD
jgi:RNA polymerase sigma-70 factor